MAKVRSLVISSGKFLEFLKELYRSIKCSVRVKEHTTGWFNIEVGRKQGCILSPALLYIFINDLAIINIKSKGIGVHMWR